MKRLLTSCAIAAALILPMTGTAHAYEPWRDKECRYQYVDRHSGWSPWEVKLSIGCATRRWGVSTSTALYVANRESHFGQYATNGSSGACGVFQHIPRYFAGRLAAVPDWFGPFGGSCYNARDNVLAAIWMARYGWGPWSL